MNSLGGAEVELIERLRFGESGGMQPLLDGGLGTRADLHREHLVQVVLVRLVLLACLAGEVDDGAEHVSENAGGLLGPALVAELAPERIEGRPEIADELIS